jgi:hypothetical protein
MGAHIHRGYVAGRYRDGALSDIWTDVARCAERTFTAYLARCGCGWLGDPPPSQSRRLPHLPARVDQHPPLLSG